MTATSCCLSDGAVGFEGRPEQISKVGFESRLDPKGVMTESGQIKEEQQLINSAYVSLALEIKLSRSSGLNQHV